MKYLYFLILAAGFFAPFAFAQVNVSTVSGPFKGSGGVKLGPDGLIYIADYGDGLSNQNGTVVWRYDPTTGIRDTFATGLSGASGNDFDSQGNLFQSNIAGNSISKIDPSGKVSHFTSQGISAPVGIVIDPQDNLFVCNCGNNTIRKITSQGVSTAFASGPVFGCPNGITMDHLGNIYVSNFNNGGTIVKIDTAGNTSLFSSFSGINNGHIIFSPADTCLYLASHGTSLIYKIEMDGTVKTLAGSGIRGNQDGPADSASFSRPNGIAVSVTGDTIYVNSSVPTSNVNFPLNPSLLRMISGVQSLDWVELPAAGQMLALYPNPSGETLFTELQETAKCAQLYLTVADARGREVLKEKGLCRMLEDRRLALPIKDLAAGNYVITIKGPGIFQRGHFIKKEE